jgi:hypothetical protein
MAKLETTGKGARTISKREQRAIDSGKNLQRRIINTALHGITDIKVLIHRSVFSGLYGYDAIKQGMENRSIYYFKNDTDAFPRYLYKANVSLSTGKVEIYTKPITTGPFCLIATNISNFPMLSFLYKGLPELKITRLEYAIDLFCRSPEAVADLFYLLRRYLYARNAKGTSMEGGKFYGWKDSRETNAVYYIRMGKKIGKHKKLRSGKHIKIYERGDDTTKIRGSDEWRHEDVNRVRIEFKLQRAAIAKKYGLSTLANLLTGPKFSEIASKFVQFKNFKSSRKLPQDWDDYLSEDEHGNIESLMEEVLSGDKVLKNIVQYIEDNRRMEALKKRIVDLATEFDKKWMPCHANS